MSKKILLLTLIIMFLPPASATFMNITYTENGTFTVPEGLTTLRVLVVAGGGSGAGAGAADGGNAGGGGGGGFVEDNNYAVVQGTTINITVGRGGWRVGNAQSGNNGTNSSFGTLNATGGGGGGYDSYRGSEGGSGGGGGGKSSQGGIGNQGRNGGRGLTDSATYDNGGGGGGAGAVGQDATALKGGNGGTGNTSSINGTKMFSCGGGGAGYTGKTAGSAGCSFAGAGGIGSASGNDAVNGTGSGGGAGATGGAGGNGIVNISYVVPPTIDTWFNNKTQNTSLAFDKLTGHPAVNFSVNVTSAPDYYSWFVDGANQNNNFYPYFNYTFLINGTFNITATAAFPTHNVSKTWNVTARNYTIELLTPANESTGVSTSPTLVWREWPNGGADHTYYISTDYQFINVVVSGTATPANETYLEAVSLAASTKYYWRIWNGSAYSNISEFTTQAAAIIPGRLNITVFDEQDWTKRIATFSAQLYNSTWTINKSTTTGWVNFSESEVSSGEYLVRIVPNSSYAPRNVLADSPGNVTVYIPSTTNTINTVAFYLLDYLGLFPWQTSKLYIWKNNSVMHSSYFDADAKVAAYLIQGDSYKITVIHDSNLQEWGNYISTASGNVEITLNDVGINYTSYQPFNHNITWTTSNITLRWSSPVGGTLTSLNFSIYKGENKQLVHQLITSVPNGLSEYIVTNTSDIYYVTMNYTLSTGTFSYTKVINYNIGNRGAAKGLGFRWDYRTFQAPEWVYNAFAIIILLVMGAGFGAMHSPLGAIITGVFAVLFIAVGWLSGTTAGMSFVGALVIYLGLYYLQEKEKKP